MATQSTKPRTTLTDLPPELWDHITHYLPTASSIASLSRTSNSLHAYVEKDAWKTFSRTRFPSICPSDTTSNKETARSLTTLSRAWDRRAFVALYVEPSGNITAYPGGNKPDKWKRPRGQTIGFTPHIDVYEEIGPTWKDRNETLAFSAGAEVCVRQTKRYEGGEDVRWTTYRPHSAREGRDDVTTIHLLKPEQAEKGKSIRMITGTANGDLQLLRFPEKYSTAPEVGITYFATQGLPVRKSSLWQEGDASRRLLASSLGDSKLALYPVDEEQAKICSSSQIEIQPSLHTDGNPAPNHRIWSTNFLSSSKLAVGIGPSDSPIHIYSLTESGLTQTPLRKFSLQEDTEKARMSAVYTTAVLPSIGGSSGSGDVFLSGAYDGIVRLHDLRSNREVEQVYADPADDSPVYSILPRGQESFLTGTSRHNILKFVDLRLGAKEYSYLDSSSPDPASDSWSDYNVFLRPSSSTFTARGGNWSQGRNRSAESSVYSLASPSSHSPYIYAGVENAIWSVAFTEFMDPHPDPVYFDPWSGKGFPKKPRAFQSKEVQDLAMYEQGANMKLCTQRSLFETWRMFSPKQNEQRAGVWDERWKGANEFGGRM